MKFLLSKMPHPGHPLQAHVIFLSILYKLLVKIPQNVEEEILRSLIGQLARLDAEINLPYPKPGQDLSKLKEETQFLPYKKQKPMILCDIYLDILIEYLKKRNSALEEQSEAEDSCLTLSTKITHTAMTHEEEVLMSSSDESEIQDRTFHKTSNRIEKDHFVDMILSIFEQKILPLT